MAVNFSGFKVSEGGGRGCAGREREGKWRGRCGLKVGGRRTRKRKKGKVEEKDQK